MDNIELDNLCEDQAERAEDTSFTENTDNADYDNIRSQINLRTVTQSRTNTGLDDTDSTDLERQIHDHAVRKAIQRYDAIQALETATGTRFSVTHGDSSKELIDNISDIKYSEKGNLIALKYKGEDVKLTKKGGVSLSAKVINKDILRALEKASVEYDASIASVIDKTADTPMSDEAVESVQENVAEELESLIDDKYDEISQKAQYDAKIAGLEANIEHWKDLEEKEQDPDKKQLYKDSEGIMYR